MHDSESLRTPVSGGQRAIEIAAALGDTVLSVHHLEPRGRRGLSRATLALIVAAAGGVITLAGAAWTAGQSSPVALDLIAGIALATSVVAAAWALARAPGELRSRRYRVGRVAGADLSTTDLPAGLAFVDVVVPTRDGFTFVPAANMTGVVVADGAERPLEELVLGHGVRIRAELGAVTLHIAEVARPVAPGAGPRVDRDVAVSGAASTLAHALVMALFVLVPATARGLSDDYLGTTTRIISASFRPREAPIEPNTEGIESVATPRPARPAHIVAIAPRSRPMEGRASTQPANPRGAGILALLRGHPLDGGALPDGFTDLPDGRGGLPDDNGAPGFGPGGPDRPGGPGDGGLIAALPPQIPLYSLGPQGPIRPALPPRHPRGPVIDISPPRTGPHVDKELIRRAVRAHLAELTHCYERELTARPDLAGTVNAELLIAADGHVTYARAAGLSPEVDACVATVLQTIRFPDGDIIHVTSYPFTFRPSGS